MINTVSAKWMTIAVVTLLMATAIGRYGGAADHYYYYYMLANNPYLLPFDYVMNDNIIFKSSIFYFLNRTLKIEEGELLLLALYFAISAFNLVIAYLILRRHVSVDRVTALALLLILGFVDRRINTNAWSLLFPVHPASSSMFGNIFALLSLYLLLERKIALAFLAISGVVLFQVKENTVLILAGLVYVATLGRQSWLKGSYALLPVGYLLFKSLTGIHYDLPYDEMVEVLRRNIVIEGRDGSFLAHTPAANFLLLGTIGLCFPLSRLFSEDLGRLMRAFAWATLAIYVSNVLYLTALWPLKPAPQLIFLGAVRNTRFVIFLFFVGAMAAIALRSPLRSYEKVAAMLALILVHGESWKGALYPALVLAGGIGLPRLAMAARPFRPALAWLDGIPWPAWAVPVFVLYAAGQVAAGGVYGNPVNPLAFEYTGRFSIAQRIDRAGWEALRRVRAMDGGGPLIVAFRAPDGSHKNSTNAVIYAHKAQFNHTSTIGLHTRPDSAFFREADWRSAVEAALLDDLNAERPIAPATLEFLRRRGVWLLTPASSRRSLESYGRAEELGGYILWRP